MEIMEGNLPTKYFINQANVMHLKFKLFFINLSKKFTFLKEDSSWSWLDILFSIILGTISLGCYVTIIFCGWKVSKFVNLNTIGKKRAFNQQLNRNLIIMVIWMKKKKI